MGKKVLVILLGLVFVGVGIFALVKGNDLAKRCTSETVGKVVEVIEEYNDDSDTSDATITITSGNYTYYPVIEYKAGDKVENHRYSSGSGDKDKYKVGDSVDILYDPNKTSDFIIKGDKTSNILGIVFIAAGVLVTVIGVVKKEF